MEGRLLGTALAVLCLIVLLGRLQLLQHIVLAARNSAVVNG
jgi:hypothetical protein